MIKNRKSICTAIAILLGLALLFLIVFIFFLPIPIDIEMSALEVKRYDPEHMEQRTVIIQGTYRINGLARGHRFQGSIKILEYPETHRDVTQTMFLSRGGGIDERGWRGDLLFYPTERQVELHFVPDNPFFLYTTTFFRNVMIGVPADGGGFSPSTEPIIVLGATTRDEAMKFVSLLPGGYVE